MKIIKFKLIDEGYSGITISGTERRIKDNFAMNIGVDNLTFKVPMPDDIITLTQRMKKYFLDLTGYWEERFDAYHEKGRISTEISTDQDAADAQRAKWLFDNTFITGLGENSGKWIITGTIKNMYNKKIGLATPAIGPDDQYSSFIKLRTGCHSIIEVINKWVDERKLRMMSERQIAMKLFEDDIERIEEISGMSDEQVKEIAMKHIEKQGGIVPLEGKLVKSSPVPKAFKKEKKDITDMVDKQQKEHIKL